MKSIFGIRFIRHQDDLYYSADQLIKEAGGIEGAGNTIDHLQRSSNIPGVFSIALVVRKGYLMIRIANYGTLSQEDGARILKALGVPLSSE